MARRRKRNRHRNLVSLTNGPETYQRCEYRSFSSSTLTSHTEINYPRFSPAYTNFNMVLTATTLSSDGASSTPEAVGSGNGVTPDAVAQAADEDVVYLYTVSGGQLVEVVDLAEDAQNQEPNSSNRSFILASEATPENHSANQNSSILQELTARDVSVICIADKKDATVKPDVKALPSRKRKRSSGEARCFICDKNYERITDAGGELYSSRCGHLFCLSCLKKLDPYHCTKCNSKISNLWKIYL